MPPNVIDDQEGITTSSYETTMWSWSIRETSHWSAQHLDYDATLAEFERLRQEVKPICYYEIRAGQVSIREEIESLTAPERERKLLYLAFLRDTVRLFCPALSTDLIIFCGDKGIDSHVPIFSFQKLINQTCILLPDVDFLRDKFFYPHNALQDNTCYEEKASSAIFAGSTSGYSVTEDTIKKLLHPRIRAAVYFRNSDCVEFYIPSIVQYDSPKTKELLLSMGLGTPPIHWSEQFGHKFIISMDGNGATCSRLAITFRSNSVILKYASDSILYYFSGLIPWLHYIPISSEDQVIRVVQAERVQPGRFSYIPKAAQNFAKTYLTRYRSMLYTSWLLKSYSSWLSPSSHLGAASKNGQSESLSDEAEFGGILVHIAERGDVWCSANKQVGMVGSGLEIQGFYIEPGVALGLDEISYRIVHRDGSLSSWHDGGVFCGTRGRSEPIFGFSVRLRGKAAEKYKVSFSGVFIGGIVSGPCTGNDICKLSDNRPLECMTVRFRAIDV